MMAEFLDKKVCFCTNIFQEQESLGELTNTHTHTHIKEHAHAHSLDNTHTHRHTSRSALETVLRSFPLTHSVFSLTQSLETPRTSSTQYQSRERNDMTFN